jgi:hypothetical protein
MVRRAKGDKEDTVLDEPSELDLRTSNQTYVQLSFQLPAFYVHVLDGEAELLSQRRSTLLELLVLRKAGVIQLERSANAPKIKLDRSELHVLKRYVWHCRPDIKERLDRLRERMGNIPPRSWVILALNEWIGLPAGVSDLGPVETEAEDEAPTAVHARPKPAPPPSPPGRRKPPAVPRSSK